MTNLVDEGKGAARVRFRNRRWWGLLLGAFAILGALRLIAHFIWPHGPRLGDRMDPTFAISASIATAIIGLVFVIYYHKIIDEQEERAALWAYTIGFYALALSNIVWFLLFSAKLVPVAGLLVAILGSCLIAGAIQLWLQFR